ncbi:Histone H3 [Seminavis robusta]|uniref:Histone H3 n=1 Tax=Seminavis robusta TaxID=568900 RepID=A0A9N8HE53_9STRA|nr:Histone H3 [Seminavis robusta]|eukprot:Sro497_g154680.1 Histone H3 (234) ;mRNA; f:1159-1860
MSTDELIPRAPFVRVVKDISQDVLKDKDALFKLKPDQVRWSKEAIDALKATIEDDLTNVFKQAVKCQLHAKRTTLMPSDMKLYMNIAESQKNFYENVSHDHVKLASARKEIKTKNKKASKDVDSDEETVRTQGGGGAAIQPNQEKNVKNKDANPGNKQGGSIKNPYKADQSGWLPCGECNNLVGGAFKCIRCEKNMHKDCGRIIPESEMRPGEKNGRMCTPCSNESMDLTADE